MDNLDKFIKEEEQLIYETAENWDEMIFQLRALHKVSRVKVDFDKLYKEIKGGKNE